MSLPTGTVTFLFTDIEGSTQHWERHPDGMRDALPRHDALIRAAVEQSGGMVLKATGDGFCCTFDSAPQALSAAVKAQQALFTHDWKPPAVLRVRMGLHTGTAELREGDYFGPTLNRVARLMAVGHGGQVLLSATTQALVREHLPAGTHLICLGDHRLKDLTYPETVYQMVHPALPAQFPGLRSLNSPDLPNNLPNQLTSFIGREAQIETVQALLKNSRLLTLMGSGGCGKTRLALQVAANVLEEYPDGVWLLELAALTDPALVLSTLAGVLGVAEEPGRPLLDALIDHLHARQALLIWDNCEHLLETCAQGAGALLAACPGLCILATSLEALGIYGERSYRVPSLSLPALATVAAAGLMTSEAAQLFCERARLTAPNFVLNDQNALPVARLCYRLDGIPLAIELAAARMRSMTVAELAQRLDDRFHILTGGSRNALPRQKTLLALMDWSYDLLSSGEQSLLEQLSLFVGGWTLEAAEAVCACAPETAPAALPCPDVLDLLTSLVDKSLVIAETQGDETRYRLLETVRQYAREKLAQEANVELVHLRHRDYFARFAILAAPELQGAQQSAWMARLETERDNLRAALDAYADTLASALSSEARQGPAAAWLEMASALERFWYVRGPVREGRARLEQALNAAGGVGGKARAEALNSAGILAEAQGDHARAFDFHRENLVLRRQLQDRRGIATSLNNLAVVANGMGDYPVMQRCLEESLSLYRELQHPLGIAVTLNNLGGVASKQNDYVTAERCYRESLECFRALDHPFFVAAGLHNLADVLIRTGELAQAETYLGESVAIYREMDSRSEQILSLERLAAIAVREERYQQAVRWLEAAEAARRETGASRAVSEEQDVETDRALAAAALEPGEFAVVRSQGERLRLEDALKEALPE